MVGSHSSIPLGVYRTGRLVWQYGRLWAMGYGLWAMPWPDSLLE
jgi:hypothetical protein